MTAFITQRRSPRRQIRTAARTGGLADLGDLIPIHAGGAVLVGYDRIDDADADDGADQGVRARGGNAKPPGTQVPDDRGDEQCEHHCVPGAGTDLNNELDGQQRHDAERHGAARNQNADEIEKARPHDGNLRRQGVGVDDRGDRVGGVVEAVDEFEPECDQQGDAEQDERQDRRRSAAGRGHVRSDRIGHVEQAQREDGEDAERHARVDRMVEMRLDRRFGARAEFERRMR